MLPPGSSSLQLENKEGSDRRGVVWRCDINDVDRLAALNYVISLRAHKDVACLSLAAFTLLFVSLFSFYSSYIIYFLVCVVCMCCLFKWITDAWNILFSYYFYSAVLSFSQTRKL